MKKLALASLVAVFAVSAANAGTSHFVGGSAALGFDNHHANVLSVAPEFGWVVDSKWDLGIAAKFGYDHGLLPEEYDVDGDAYTYGAGVFARYHAAKFGNVSLLFKGTVGVDFATYNPEGEGLDTETTKMLSAAIIPMITYDISESFTLYANLNFLGVYAGYAWANDEIGFEKGWGFGAYADSDNVANTSDFQIGFTYNF